MSPIFGRPGAATSGRTFCALLFITLFFNTSTLAQTLRLGYFVGDTQTQGVVRAWQRVLQEHPDLRERVELVLVSQALIDAVPPAQLATADLLVLSTHEQASIDAYDQHHGGNLIADAQRSGRVFGVGEGVFQEDHYTNQGVVWDRRFRAYFEQGGDGNTLAMMKYALRELGVSGLEIPEPQAALDFGFYYPDENGGHVFPDWDAFDTWRANNGKHRPGATRVAVSFYSSYYYSGNTEVIDAVIREVEAHGAEAIPLFGYPDELAYENMLVDASGEPRVDAALAFSLRFASPGSAESLGKVNVPIINLITLYGRGVAEWENSREGLTTFEGTFQIATPELGGLIAPTVVGSLEKQRDPVSGLSVVGNKPIPDQVRKAVRRGLNYAALQDKRNADKKIAIVYYNYPPGKASIGASYLNVPESLSALLNHLKAAGYGIDRDDLDTDSILQAITTQAYNVGSYAPGELQTLVERGSPVRVNQAEYRNWLDKFAPALRDKILKDWGDPATVELMAVPGSDGAEFVLPMIDYGNVIVLPQPVRGWGDDHEKMYHAKDLAPHHQYVATYAWLRNVFQADAVVHLGTHGTLEWLDGKDAGLSSSDAPDALIADMPNIYIYNVDVVGEGLVARRRGAASLVDHMTPPFAKGGTYGPFSDLNEQIKEYQINDSKNPELAAIYAEQIGNSTRELGIAKTLGLDDAVLSALDGITIGRIQDHLLELEAQNIPYGLHTFGVLPPDEQTASTVDAIVSADRSLLPNQASVLADEMQVRIRESATRELGNFTRGLAGEYLRGGNGGEPIRNPDAYPTGKNFYGIDPDKVPKRASWELGVKLADQMLAEHVAKHGAYPEKISFVIWGGETMRHEGVMESQILHLLGARPVWNSRDKVVDIDVVPAAQLGRPRVDIVIASAAEGMFSNITQLMDKAVQQVKLLDEAENYVREHYLETRAALIGKGYDAERADRLAGVRIFDEPPGTYNLNTARIVESSGTWDSDVGFANDYMKKMGHGYGNGFRGEPMEDAFRLALSGTEKVVHSNSTNLYGALDNDDFYMYMGGLASAVRTLDGASPELLVTNTRNPARPEMTGIDEFIGLEFRSRYVNPVWIAGMQQEGYAGAAEMIKFVEYLWGWDATVTEVVDDAMWQEAFEVYVEDRLGMNMEQFFAEHSPHAYQEITSRMLETIRKDYWQANAETETTLLREYLESVAANGAACSDHTCGNPRLLEFVVTQARVANLPAPLIDGFVQQMETAIGGNVAELARQAEAFVARNEARIERRQEVAANGQAPSEVAGFAMERINSPDAAPTTSDSTAAEAPVPPVFAALLLLTLLLAWRQWRLRASRHLLQFVLLATTALYIQPQAHAAQPESGNPLEEIVVTSSRIPVPLRQIGTSVSVIDAIDLQAHGNLALSDVLRQLPAISTSSNGGAGKTTTMRIRGEEGFRTLTIFDGLRLSDPSAPQVGPQLEHMMSSGIGRVEILRGPQGLSYGADAGGVVNISSRQASQELQFNLDAQGGKFDTKQYAANIGGGNGRADFFVAGSRFETTGFNTRTSDAVLRDADGYENTTLHLRGGVDLAETLRMELVHRAMDGDSEYDGCSTSGTFATTHDCRSLFDLTASRGALDYTGANFSHSLAYATTVTDRDNLANGTSTFPARGELNRWEYVGSATSLPGVDLVFGADLEEAVQGERSRDNTGTYAEFLSDFSDSLYLTAGVRHDDNEDFGTNTSYRVSAAYLIDMADEATLKFKGSYGTGFRAPSPFEIAYNAGASALPPASLLSLQQETSKGHEAGIEYLRGSELRLEAVYFDQRVDDAIYFDLASFSGYLQDAGVSISKGIELSGEWSPATAWRFTANYTYNDTERPNGLPRLRRPQDLLNLGASWYSLNDRLNLNAYYRVSRDSIDVAGENVIQMDDFAVLDLSANFSVSDKLQVYGRIENALDEDYEEIVGYHTAGRAAYVGFRLNYPGL